MLAKYSRIQVPVGRVRQDKGFIVFVESQEILADLPGVNAFNHQVFEQTCVLRPEKWASKAGQFLP